MVLAIITLIVILITVWFLFIPINIYINTESNQFYAELKGLAKASIEPDEHELFRIRLKVPFKDFYFFPLKALIGPQKKEKKNKKRSKSRKKFTPKTILKLIRSFKIKKCDLDMDTGNCITNAKLYPLFAFLNHHFGGFHINFEGRNHALLLVRNRPIYIIKSFINL